MFLLKIFAYSWEIKRGLTKLLLRMSYLSPLCFYTFTLGNKYIIKKVYKFTKFYSFYICFCFSSFDALKKSLVGVQKYIQATDLSEASQEAVEEKLRATDRQ